jgi:hypothetical protein
MNFEPFWEKLWSLSIRKGSFLIYFAVEPIGHFNYWIKKLKQAPGRRVIELMRLEQFYNQILKEVRWFVKDPNL